MCPCPCGVMPISSSICCSSPSYQPINQSINLFRIYSSYSGECGQERAGRWASDVQVSQKHATIFCPYLRQILTDFKHSITGTQISHHTLTALLHYLVNITVRKTITIAKVSSCARRLFGHLRKFRLRSR